MAAAFDNATTSSATSGDSGSFTHTPVGTPTEAFVHLVFDGITASVTGAPTYGGNAMSLMVGPDRRGGSSMYVYRLTAPPAGAQTVEYELDTSGLKRVAGVVTITGSDALTLNSGGGGSSNLLSIAMAAGSLPSNAGIVVAFGMVDNAGSVTATPTSGYGMTEHYDVAPGSGTRPRAVFATRPTAAQSSDTLSFRYARWDLTATRAWAGIGLSFSPIPIYADATIAPAMSLGVTPTAALIATPANAAVSIGMALATSITVALPTFANAAVSVAMSLVTEIVAELGLRAFINPLKRFAISQLTLRNRDRQIEVVARQV